MLREMLPTPVITASSVDTQSPECQENRCAAENMILSPMNMNRTTAWQSSADPSCEMQWIKLDWSAHGPQEIESLLIVYGDMVANTTYFKHIDVASATSLEVSDADGMLLHSTDRRCSAEVSRHLPHVMLPSDGMQGMVSKLEQCFMWNMRGVKSVKINFKLMSVEGKPCQMDILHIHARSMRANFMDESVMTHWAFVASGIALVAMVAWLAGRMSVTREKMVGVNRCGEYTSLMDHAEDM
ncbi:hypothetical protein BC830DRAFT_1080165 [Chytriomyces sp. MP71]|nr:hypothetical protein BC830DRAFT_1080165 [Chytriomyces sp. MP71]